jgi:DNA-directed RNA polymerase specialized sigma24 family protein
MRFLSKQDHVMARTASELKAVRQAEMDRFFRISPAFLRDWRAIPSEAVEREEVRKLIQQAVEELPDIYRQVSLLRCRGTQYQ